MLNINSLRSPNYNANRSRQRRPDQGGWYECILCGKPCNPETSHYVHVHDGGSAIVTEQEASKMDSGADLGGHPIGSDCLRKHPEIKPYAKR